jgi:hypothetical protein
MTWVNGNLNTEFGFNYCIDISERTARNWLHKLHFDYDEYRNGCSYVDGYERQDVVDYLINSLPVWRNGSGEWNITKVIRWRKSFPRPLEQINVRSCWLHRMRAYFKLMMGRE